MLRPAFHVELTPEITAPEANSLEEVADRMRSMLASIESAISAGGKLKFTVQNGMILFHIPGHHVDVEPDELTRKNRRPRWKNLLCHDCYHGERRQLLVDAMTSEVV